MMMNGVSNVITVAESTVTDTRDLLERTSITSQRDSPSSIVSSFMISPINVHKRRMAAITSDSIHFPHRSFCSIGNYSTLSGMLAFDENL